MRAVQRYVVVVWLLVSLVAGTTLASRGDDGTSGRQIGKGSHRNLIQRILDFLDSRISLPPG